MKTLCFTGHRKIGIDYYDMDNPTFEWMEIKSYLSGVIYTAIKSYKVKTFYSGLAIGVDQLAAQCVDEIRTRRNLDDINLIGVKPFPSQGSRWPKKTKENFYKIVSMCNNVVNVSEDPYAPWKMMVRNKWMVDYSDYVVAVYKRGSKGGTHHCVDYAIDSNKKIFHVNVEDLNKSEWILF